jgi:hypothetical protein
LILVGTDDDPTPRSVIQKDTPYKPRALRGTFPNGGPARRCHSGRWQTASMLLPSGSRT